MNAAADDDYIVLFHCNKGVREMAPGIARMREYTGTLHFWTSVAIREQREAYALPSRFSSNSVTGEPEVTSISPSTMAPLAIAMVRALTLPCITAV